MTWTTHPQKRKTQEDKEWENIERHGKGKCKLELFYSALDIYWMVRVLPINSLQHSSVYFSLHREMYKWYQTFKAKNFQWCKDRCFFPGKWWQYAETVGGDFRRSRRECVTIRFTLADGGAPLKQFPHNSLSLHFSPKFWVGHFSGGTLYSRFTLYHARWGHLIHFKGLYYVPGRIRVSWPHVATLVTHPPPISIFLSAYNKTSISSLFYRALQHPQGPIWHVD